MLNSFISSLTAFIKSRLIKPKPKATADLDSIVDLMLEESKNFINLMMAWEPSPEDLEAIRKILPANIDIYKEDPKKYFRMLQEQFILDRFSGGFRKAIDYLTADINNLSPHDKVIHYFQMSSLFYQMSQVLNATTYTAVGYNYLNIQTDPYLDGYVADDGSDYESAKYSTMTLDDLFASTEDADLEDFNNLVSRLGIVGDA